MFIWQPIDGLTKRLGKLYMGFGPTGAYVSEKVGNSRFERIPIGLVTTIGVEGRGKDKINIQAFVEVKFRILHTGKNFGSSGEHVKLGGISIVAGFQF